MLVRSTDEMMIVVVLMIVNHWYSFDRIVEELGDVMVLDYLLIVKIYPRDFLVEMYEQLEIQNVLEWNDQHRKNQNDMVDNLVVVVVVHWLMRNRRMNLKDDHSENNQRKVKKLEEGFSNFTLWVFDEVDSCRELNAGGGGG